VKKQASASITCCIAVLGAAGALTAAQAGEHESTALLPEHFSGLLNDYTPSAAVTAKGPYEMRGKWTLDVDERHGTATFTAEMNMETSDYGITQGTVDKDDPKTRGAHTHHMVMTDGVITFDWATASVCPVYSPAVMGGFVVTGPVYITGNGGPASFGNPTKMTLCVLGGTIVKYSNIEFTLGLPASSHFGTQAVHGVVLGCLGPWRRESHDCAVEQ
jgi:hypothetical protein